MQRSLEEHEERLVLRIRAMSTRALVIDALMALFGDSLKTSIASNSSSDQSCRSSDLYSYDTVPFQLAAAIASTINAILQLTAACTDTLSGRRLYFPVDRVLCEDIGELRACP